MTVVRIIETPEELNACFSIRKRVFIEEQKVPFEEEIDGKDDVCTHFLALPDEAAPLADALGTARLYITDDGKAKAQRVAVLASARGRHIGHALMDALEDEAARRRFTEVILGAQLSAVGFYEKRGYAPYGDIFDDAGIPHRMMRRALPRTI